LDHRQFKVAAFSPAAGYQLGYNELKTLEVERLATAIRVAAREERWVTVNAV